MPKNLTPISQYTGNLVVPIGGDARTAASVEPGFQTLGDRALYAKTQLDILRTYAQYEIDAFEIASGAIMTLTEEFDVGGFTLASNKITLPAAGVYEVSVDVSLTGQSTNNPLQIGINLMTRTDADDADSTVQEYTTHRTSATVGVSAPHIAFRSIFNCTDIAIKKLWVTAYVAASTLSVANGNLVIRRIT